MSTETDKIRAPWRLERYQHSCAGSDEPLGYAIIDSSGQIVADDEPYYPERLKPEHAPLIAAAPDLLEALKYAVRFLNAHDHDIDFVLAAIAKAEGRE